ncbi:hypothetical protein [Microcystis phage Mvi-JY20]|uniref:Rad50/SbcC-type AAA domain-containing protein n=1 Tax=Microcystis phage Mvi-JY20 TaxID=3128146 RepID=A0AAX4QH70_9CAUD
MATLAQKHIREVRVVNYLSHVDTRATFTSGINVIRGANGSGKTALVNAISATLLGLSIPKEDIRHGQKSMSIEVTLVDGTRIKRSRTNTTQTYTIYDPATGQENTYNGVSDDTKELLAKVTGMGQQRLSQRETPVSLNFEPIGSDAFLVEGASPAVLLNRISSLQPGPDFSAARKSLITDAGKHKRDLASIQTTIKGLETEQQQLQSSAWDAYAEKVAKAQELLREYRDLESDCSVLEGILADIHFLANEKRTRVTLPKAHISKIAAVANTVDDLMQELKLIDDTVHSIRRYREAVEARKAAQAAFDAIGTLTPCSQCNRLVLGGNPCQSSS